MPKKSKEEAEEPEIGLLQESKKGELAAEEHHEHDPDEHVPSAWDKIKSYILYTDF